MDELRERCIAIIGDWILNDDPIDDAIGLFARLEAEIGRTHAVVPLQARPLDKWHEDIGDVMWVKFPIDEPPYVGTPNDMGQPFEVELRCVDGGAEVVHQHTVGGWPGYHTHWIPLPDMNRVVAATPPASTGGGEGG